MQCRPLAPYALHVKRSPMDFKPVDSIRRALRGLGDAQAGPHSYGGLLVIPLSYEGDRAIHFEGVPPQYAAEMIGCMFLFLPSLHTLLRVGTLSTKTNLSDFPVPAILLQPGKVSESSSYWPHRIIVEPADFSYIPALFEGFRGN